MCKSSKKAIILLCMVFICSTFIHSETSFAVTPDDVIKNIIQDTGDIEDFEDIFDNAVISARIQSLFTDTAVYEYYRELDSELQQEILRKLANSSFGNADKFKYAFAEATIPVAFKNAKTDEKAYEILRSNNDILRIHFYLSDERYISACKKLRRKEIYNSLEHLVEDFEDTADVYSSGGGGGAPGVSPPPNTTSEICGENLSWKLSDGILTISGNGEMLDFTTRFHPPWYDAEDTITEIIIENGVENIGNNAFLGCYNATTVRIPDTATHIGSYAFSGCNKAAFLIPDGITYIGAYAFNNCKKLEEISIPNAVSINNSAFKNCVSLKNIEMPEKCNNLGDNTFRGCISLTHMEIPDGISYIAIDTFNGCENLEYVSVPHGVKTIGNNAFSDCFSLKEIYIPDTVTSICYEAFSNCTLIESLIIPDSVTKIDSYAFEGCTRLKSVTIPTSVSYIGRYAFGHCSNMKNVTVCSSYVSADMFNWCIRLENITFTNNIAEIRQNAFEDCVKLTNVGYSGNSSQWDLISISESNDPLLNAVKTFNVTPDILQITVSKTENYDVFSIIPSNIPVGSMLIFVCYKDGKIMHTETRVYNGESPLYFVEYTGIDYDNAKIFIWSGLNIMTPLDKCKTINI